MTSRVAGDRMISAAQHTKAVVYPVAQDIGLLVMELESPHLFEDMSDAALAAAFEAEFGKRPHHRMKRDTIVRKLNDACNECA